MTRQSVPKLHHDSWSMRPDQKYDEDGLLGGLEDDDASDEDSDEESDVDEGEFDGDDQDEDGGGANMGYAVPALLLQHVLEDYSTAVRQAAQ
eukprot:scaffold216294_cov14-Tisochrysis_lutea.AAC.1